MEVSAPPLRALMWREDGVRRGVGAGCSPASVGRNIRDSRSNAPARRLFSRVQAVAEARREEGEVREALAGIGRASRCLKRKTCDAAHWDVGCVLWAGGGARCQGQALAVPWALAARRAFAVGKEAGCDHDAMAVSESLSRSGGKVELHDSGESPREVVPE